MEITQLLNDYFAPAAADSVYQEVARFLQFKCTGPTMDEYPVRSDPSCCKAESKTHAEGATPGKFASALCMQNVSLLRSAKSLMAASVRGDLGISAVS